MINPIIKKAYKILSDEVLDKKIILDLCSITGSDILDLISLANKVTEKFCGSLHICSIMNIKSGQCSENCSFCAQSIHHRTYIEIYPLLNKDKIIKKAEYIYNKGIRNFGLVTSGEGFNKIDDEFLNIIKTIEKLKITFPDLNICSSLGNLTEEPIRILSEAGILHYNINFQTSLKKYNVLVSANEHINKKLKTVKFLKKYKIKVCSGGILGLGENIFDRIDLAYKLNELKIDVIPINILIPILGTPLENSETLSAAEIAKSIALFRLINPKTTIKFAAGRETIMKDFQSLLLLSGANGYLTGGYLTTKGRKIEEDKIFKCEIIKFRG